MRVFAALGILTIAGHAGVSAASAMTLTSPDVTPGGRIAGEQTFNAGECVGGNVSPTLAWSGAPKGTKSFAVSMDDPDSPGGGFWHWWVANLPADTTGLPKGAGSGTGLPAGAVQARNDYGTMGYGGPCPPPGKPHHYQITVYALDVDKLGVDPNASPAVVGFNVHAHTLAKATLTGLYGR